MQQPAEAGERDDRGEAEGQGAGFCAHDQAHDHERGDVQEQHRDEEAVTSGPFVGR
ncbi:hypothetical protein PSU4_39280 [Pseudonocardia sulfidoxydans NBRC 16205]|uniref:Uncharacterized protein n=1 Tax=Pseudonocardia sulfidoxydans NBRC 16205 TaxID=1223511 RepID=A0A511DMF3_9PSEU|nr:hypothetical protein PSU4_39280 [Pseudonocardia sulfidoxydans NBRC 16205]